MLAYLESGKSFRLDYQDKNTLKGQIAETRVDLITHSYPLIKQLVVSDGIRLASLEDISAMKLNAIVGNGTRLKDFIDIAFLSSHLPLKTMIGAYEDKYTSRNPVLTLKALAYHQDINFNEQINIIGGNYTWKAIAKRLSEMEKYPEKIFEKAPLPTI